MHQETIRFPTSAKEDVVDITSEVARIVAEHPEATLCAVYARGATAAIMVQEGWDKNIGVDVLACLAKLAPHGSWLHDRIDSNGAAHLKSGIVGPSETIPAKDGKLLLSQWQNIFLCEFDGPRSQRKIVLTVVDSD